MPACWSDTRASELKHEHCPQSLFGTCHGIPGKPFRHSGLRSTSVIPDQREAAIEFRPLCRADLPALLRWLSDPDVSRWYSEGELSLENLERQYGPGIDGLDPVDQYVVRIDGQDAEYIQAYVIDDEPDYVRQLEVEPGAVGIDMFIGEPAIRGRGWGAPVLRTFVDRIVFGTMRAPIAIIAPDPANERAIHVYAKAGFRWRKTVPIVDDQPWNTGDEYVMTMSPGELAGPPGANGSPASARGRDANTHRPEEGQTGGCS